MAFSYSGNPATSAVDQLRLLSGDTVESVSLLTDEEAAWLLAQHTTATAALVPALRIMLAKVAHDTLIRADGVERDLKSRMDTLKSMLEDEVIFTSVSYAIPPFLGGVSIAERETRKADTDLIQPAFTTEQDAL